MRRIGEVSIAYPHVAYDRAGHGDGESDSQDGVGDGQRHQVTVAQEEQAGRVPPDEGSHGEDGVGKVGERKDGGGRQRSSPGAAQKTQQTSKEEDL